MFESLAKQAEILENSWVTHLLGLLPYNVAQLIAKEPDEIANDYGEVKKISLKRYKLTPEKFRQKFFMHNKNLGSTWKNFAYELRCFFNEWVNGVKADSFEKLSDLIITDQIKRKVSQEIKDHFMDEWSKLNSPDDLVEKLDDYDTLRSTLRSKRPRKEWHYDKQDSLKDDSAFTTNGNKKNCTVLHIMRGVNQNASTVLNSGTFRRTARQVGENSEDGNSYLKKAKLNNFDPVQALIDTGSSCCLLKTSVAQKLKLIPEPTVNEIYGFGNQKMPALTSMGRITADIEVDNVKGEGISVYFVPDEVQPLDIIIGRTWLDLPHIAYTRIGNRVHIGYREDEPFRNFPIDENISRICLKALEATKLEKSTVDLVSSRAESIENGLIMIENPSEDIGCLLEVKDGKTCVPLANIGDKNIEFLKDQCLGRAEVIELCSNVKVKERMQISNNLTNFIEKVPIILSEINIDSNIENERKQELVQLLNEYRDCFALNISELRSTNLTKMDI
ncbi:hypothetical protein AVEN_33080-1 [Araneus ventricosus]|uniref:Peptidase A2 domain-containing protein n=1 Tax=Araneus ventricosus TaxID=182803 RepID=A0A4Y2CVM8_ARAVE|nr:hypothetical protein AVEN_33080-1 [Araneus ventricosus]